MKCPKCGLENNENNKFCQGCGTPLQQTPAAAPSPTEIQHQPKKAWYKRWWVWLIIGLSVIMLLLGGTCTACTCALLSQPVKQTSEATFSTLSDDDLPYKEYTFLSVSIKVPQTWSKLDKDQSHYFYDSHGDMFYIYTNEVGEASLGDYYFDSIKEGIVSSTENYKEISSAREKIDDELAYNLKYSCNLNGEPYLINSYITYFDNYLYTFNFASQGSTECPSLTKEKSKILHSVRFTRSQTSTTAAPTIKKPTEAPTEKKTEKPTEPPTEKQTEKPTEGISRVYSNALKQAESYLKHSAFSKDGLYEQLLFEKYSEDAATYAVEHVSTDWNANALKKAESYISHTAFSQEGLYEQLLFEKYTEEQARYGANNVKADWNEMAVKKAESYLKLSSFSKDDLYEQLIFEKYTPEQAQYAVDKVY